MSQYFLMCIACQCYALATAIINMFYGMTATVEFLMVLGVI